MAAALLPATVRAHSSSQAPAPVRQAPAPQAPAPQAPAPQAPAAQTPTPPAGATPPGAPPPAVAAPGTPVAAAPPPGRLFTAPTGLIFNVVRTERVKDFETFLGHLKVALDKATDPTVVAQARGWRVFRAVEAGPNNTVLFVFALDPAVKGADYSLGRILSDAYPDGVQLAEIWKLYTGSVVGGGTLLNLSPVASAPPMTPAAPAPAPAVQGVTPAQPTATPTR